MRYHGKHINHEPNSLDSWHRRRLSPVVRNWLMDVVARSDNWETFRNLSRPDAETLEILESGGLTSAEPVSVSEVVRVRRSDFHNFRRRYIKIIAQYDDDCWKSLQKYGEQIEMDGGIALLRDLSLGHRSGKNHSKDFLFAFCTCWQLSLLRRYSSILCLDSTHNTCCSLESNHAAFLHSIVIKHDGAGCGIPVAFMITSKETMLPLEEWLRWLNNAVPFERTPIFMIDCSKTEVAAIKSVFPESSIRFCHWHLFRALSSQARNKISNEADRKSALGGFRTLLRTRTLGEFYDLWGNYENSYQKYPEWIRYVKLQWIKDTEKWWSGYRMVRSKLIDLSENE